MRAVCGLPSLRRAAFVGCLRRAIAVASNRTFRIVHFSIQTNHVHLLVETDRAPTLARGMQGLAARLAKIVNRILGRHGRVWSDRYHARALRTPREVRHALVYVLMNGRKHAVSGRGIDTCSSGPWFDGWREAPAHAPPPGAPVIRARTWLLAVGWRRWGLIPLDAAPVF